MKYDPETLDALRQVLAAYRKAIRTGNTSRFAGRAFDRIEARLCSTTNTTETDPYKDCRRCPLDGGDDPNGHGCTKGQLQISFTALLHHPRQWGPVPPPPRLLALRYFALRAKAYEVGLIIDSPRTEDGTP